jgi:lysine 2,3-aminomutase
MNAVPKPDQVPPDTTLRRAVDLVAAGLVPANAVAMVDAVAGRYAVAIPPAMAALIDRSDPGDPIARQFVPSDAELRTLPEERTDPIGDQAHSPVPGIVHRYPDRVLLKLVQVCPVYCRFCFRREMVGPGKSETLDRQALDRALDYIATTPAIWEVVITGGDPLMLSPRRIREVTERLARIGHVRIVRWHSRVPVVTPEAITPALVDAVRASGKSNWVAVHSNHPREFTDAARAACAILADAGIVLVGQTVLLRGVNDQVETLAALMRAFVEARVKPYYLHHPDLAPGTSHFRLSIAEGQALVGALRGHVSGLCQPTYVLDLPGGHGKVPLGPVPVVAKDVSAADDDNQTMLIVDFLGRSHTYPPRSF